jgi:hypothetical protein
VLRAAHVSKSPPDKLRAWALKVHRSRGHNKAAIAVANKLARIVWAVSAREESYQSAPVAALERSSDFVISFLPSDRGCDDTHRSDGVPVGPARGQADNTRGPLEVFKPIGSPCAAFHHGPEHPDAPLRGRRYVCSLTLPSRLALGTQPRGRFSERGT